MGPNRNGETTTYRYDRDARPVEINMPGRTLTYAYDGLGRAVRATAGDITIELTYDPRSQVSGITTSGSGLPTIAFAYTYDASGAIISSDGPGGKQAFRYDQDGPLTVIGGGVTRMLARELPGGVVLVVQPWRGLWQVSESPTVCALWRSNWASVSLWFWVIEDAES